MQHQPFRNAAYSPAPSKHVHIGLRDFLDAALKLDVEIVYRFRSGSDDGGSFAAPLARVGHRCAGALRPRRSLNLLRHTLSQR